MTEASLAALDGDRLTAWRRQHAVTRNATLILTGDVDRKVLRTRRRSGAGR